MIMKSDAKWLRVQITNMIVDELTESFDVIPHKTEEIL